MIAYQQGKRCRDSVAMMKRDREGCCNEITYGYTLHDTPYTEMREIERASVTGHVKPVNQQADNKQLDCTLNYLADYIT